jgi:hypothetical protein
LRGNAPPIFLYLKIDFLLLIWRGANRKVEIFSKRISGWYQERKNEKPAFRRIFPLLRSCDRASQ